MKRQKILEEDQKNQRIRPSLFRIFLWFALGAIILAVSIPRILGQGELNLAPIAGTLLGFIGIGMGLAQVIYFTKRNN